MTKERLDELERRCQGGDAIMFMLSYRDDVRELLAENARLTAQLEDAKATLEKVKNLRRAVNAQADDETLWSLPIYRQPSIQEAYLAQSLRWLHRVIEDNDEDALASIINQSNGDI